MEKKKGLLGLIMVLIILSIILLIPNKKEYKIKESVLKEDNNLNTLSMFILDGEKETPIETIPSADKYEIDQNKSYCQRDNQEIKNILKTENGNHIFTTLQSNDKCYVWFNKKKTVSDKILDSLELSSKGEIGPITGPSCNSNKNESCYTSGSDDKKNNMAQNGVYEAEDDYGTSYVFRGSIYNNFVKFGKMISGEDNGKYIWWRIIRINGNGTIRLIYAGMTSGTNKPSTTGTATQIKTTYIGNDTVQQYNATASDNRYVGFMYGNFNSTYESTHSNDQKSTIMTELETWYDKTNLASIGKVDVETGFCNDRQIAPSGTHSSYTGTGKQTESTSYAPWGRLYANNWKEEQTPTLKCGYDVTKETTNTDVRKRDLFTGPNSTEGRIDGKNGKVEGNNELNKPIGLITSDEVVYAGSFGGQNNDGYWLYTNSKYWTMSPFFFTNGYSDVFYVHSLGYLNGDVVHTASIGVRPVINLKADTQFSFRSGDSANIGTVDNPYVVE